LSAAFVLERRICLSHEGAEFPSAPFVYLPVGRIFVRGL